MTYGEFCKKFNHLIDCLLLEELGQGLPQAKSLLLQIWELQDSQPEHYKNWLIKHYP
jgi:hypothetical protein